MIDTSDRTVETIYTKAIQYSPSFSCMLLHLLVDICVCAKKRNFSLWIATTGILSVDVIVDVVVVVVVYAIRICGPFFPSRLSS
jgi:hypothetical protein